MKTAKSYIPHPASVQLSPLASGDSPVPSPNPIGRGTQGEGPVLSSALRPLTSGVVVADVPFDHWLPVRGPRRHNPWLHFTPTPAQPANG